MRSDFKKSSNVDLYNPPNGSTPLLCLELCRYLKKTGACNHLPIQRKFFMTCGEKGIVYHPDKEDKSRRRFDTGQPRKRARHSVSIVEHVYSWLGDGGDV